MSAMPWDQSPNFRYWYIEQVKKIIAINPPTIRVSGRNRELEEDDFGFNAKTYDNWKEKPPADAYPDGRKMKDIIISEGFAFFDSVARVAVVKQWIHEELAGTAHDLTDEVVGILLALVEKSPEDFLMQCLKETVS